MARPLKRTEPPPRADDDGVALRAAKRSRGTVLAAVDTPPTDAVVTAEAAAGTDVGTSGVSLLDTGRVDVSPSASAPWAHMVMSAALARTPQIDMPTCSICLCPVKRLDDMHFIDMVGVCPSATPCKLCASCARQCLEQCAQTLNARSQEAEVLLSIGAPGRVPVCLGCRRSAVQRGDTRPPVHDMARLERLVLGDPTCPCADCAHARGGPDAAARVEDDALDSSSDDGTVPSGAMTFAFTDTTGAVSSAPSHDGHHHSHPHSHSRDDADAATRGSAAASSVAVAAAASTSSTSSASRSASATGASSPGASTGSSAGSGVVVAGRDDGLQIVLPPRRDGGLFLEGPAAIGSPTTASTGSTMPPTGPLPRQRSITVAPGAPPLVTSASTSSLCSTCSCGASRTADMVAAAAAAARRAAPRHKRFLGRSVFGQRLWRKLLEHRATLQLAYRCPFGVFKRCPVPGCDSREYIVFDERSQFMRFQACNHEVCRNCEKQVVQHGPSARRQHNRQCMVTLGSQLVRKHKNWSRWRRSEAYEAAVRAMHEYTSEVVSRRQRLECPRCGVVVAKTGSCNHIVCECGEHLCQACHRRLADMLPHPVVKAANAHAVAPYGTYVAVDEVAMVQNHYEVGGWKRQEPQKRLCPRLFAEVAVWFPTVLDGKSPAPGQTAPVGLHEDSDGHDQVELNRHSQAVRLRILALILNCRVVTKSALAAVADYDRERNRGTLMEMWPDYPYLTVHELVYVMWEWGRVDPLSNAAPGSAAAAAARRTSAPAANTWLYLPTNTAFHYDPRATYRKVDVLHTDINGDAGSEETVLSIPSLLIAASRAVATAHHAQPARAPAATRP